MTKTSKMTKTIDVTPTWQGILPSLLILLKSERTSAREVAENELVRMARLADKMMVQFETLSEK